MAALGQNFPQSLSSSLYVPKRFCHVVIPQERDSSKFCIQIHNCGFALHSTPTPKQMKTPRRVVRRGDLRL